MILARVINGSIVEHRLGTEEEIVYSESDGVSIVPMPTWAVELRESNLANRTATRILKWNYGSRVFEIFEVGSFSA